MSTYTFSGTGTQALSSGTTQLQITITTRSAPARNGAANPVNRYDQGLLRFGSASGYFPAVALDADAQLVNVPIGCDRVGYALLGGGVITATEVFALTPVNALSPMPPVITPQNTRPLCDFLASAGATLIASAGASATALPLVPIIVTQGITIVEALWFNGSTVNGNIDVGVYDAGGSRLAHTGSVAQSGISGMQQAALPSTVLAPGLYYLTIIGSSGTGQINYNTVTQQRLFFTGILQAAGSFPLPSTLTFAQNTSLANVPWIGVSQLSIL